jgi:hypothetical protein
MTISIDGKSRWMDNVFIERLWRSVKYEEVHLHACTSPAEAGQGLDRYFRFYNQHRTHPGLDHRTPDEVSERTGLATSYPSSGADGHVGIPVGRQLRKSARRLRQMATSAIRFGLSCAARVAESSLDAIVPSFLLATT